MMTIASYGESSVLVNFEQVISCAVNDKVLSLRKQVLTGGLAQGIHFAVPSYCSLVIGFDREKITFDLLRTELLRLIENPLTSVVSHGIRWKIPVCYDAEFAPELELCSDELNLNMTDLIKRHTEKEYRVYACGFFPGFAYLGKTGFAISRLASPRKAVPAGSVGLAGDQTGVYPSVVPGGWKIIGRTPLSVIRSGKEVPYLFSPGDSVRFYRIPFEKFDRISKMETDGKTMVEDYIISDGN